MPFRGLLVVLCYTVVTISLMAQSPGSELSMEQIQDLREQIAKQQKQIELLQKSIAEQQKLLDSALRVVAAKPAEAPAELRKVNRKSGSDIAHSPVSFEIGDASFTPFGFVDLTYVGRSTNVASGIGTDFANIPYSSSAPGRIGENNFSTQNSRLGLRVDSNVHGAKVLGYFEADFLGNQPPNVFNSSNSGTFRMRNAFADIQKGSFEFTGGQDWSLMTPGKSGISPIPNDIFYTQVMDTNYLAGLVWARQTQVRFAYHPNKNFHAALSLENPQQYVGGSSGGPTITFPAAFASKTAITNQFNSGSNDYSVPNSMPDVIAKVAFESHPGGKLQHIEIAGLLRRFKYFNPIANNSIGQMFSAVGGGGSVNGNFEIFKNVRLIANTFFSDGGGRYLFGMAPDLTLRPDGSISLVHAFSTLDGIEANFTKNLLLYSYYSGVYTGRNSSLDATGKYSGYGYFGSPNSQNRDVQEFTIGLTPTIWKSPQYGALQLITQYSYLWRAPWYAADNSPRNAKTNMVWVNLRYTIP
ncbi:MAG TPA: hypothetical protein VN633_00735 [Bryobacteraceae bacterium]|nr:hypothetical protein [Bryobacteraceae bacterium]